MGLSLKSFAQFTSDLQSGISAATKLISDFSVGSVAAALTNTISTQLGFVQSQASAILLITRAATSTLPDVITFVADYFLTPNYLGPTYATDVAIFSRNQPSPSPQVLLDGTIIQNQTPSPTSAIQFVVIANPNDQYWSANAGGANVPGRTLPANETQLTGVSIKAAASGSGSNVIPGALSVIASPGVPFDTVSNPNLIDNGNNGETVAQLRQRFSDYISTRSGTVYSVAAAVESVQAGLSFTLNDLTYQDGTPRDGNGTIVVDDGSGDAPDSLLAAVLAAVVNPLQKSFGSHVWVVRPTVVAITVAVTGTTIATNAGFSPTDVRSALASAIVAFVNANGVGGAPAGTGSGAPSLKLSYVALANLVASFIGTNPGQGLSSYGAITLNGAQLDVPLTTFQLARTGATMVTVS